MITQEIIALAATIWDEAKNLDLAYRTGQASTLHAKDLATHVTRCAALYSKICEQGTPGYQLQDVRAAAAAIKVIDALEQTDVDQIRVPAVLALALLNLERVIRTKTVELGSTVMTSHFWPSLKQENTFADTLAKKCDELQTKNEALSLLVETLKAQLTIHRTP